MSARPRLLDLFCCEGGAAVGYNQAGFDVTGVDIQSQKHYPFRMFVGDAIQFVKDRGHEYDAIHASPPCQAYTSLKVLSANEHPDLVGVTREALIATGKPWIIENVVGAPLIDPIMLCGTEFGLEADCRDGARRQLRRHRLFESSIPITRKGACAHKGQAVGVYGSGGGGQQTRGYKGYPEEARDAMGIQWMGNSKRISQAIPPAYTEWLGGQLIAHCS